MKDLLNIKKKAQEVSLETLARLQVKKNLAKERRTYFQGLFQSLKVERFKFLKKKENQNYYNNFKNQSRVLKYREKNNFFNLNRREEKKKIFYPLLKEHKKNLKLKIIREQEKKKKKENKEKEEKEKKERERLELLKKARENYIPFNFKLRIEIQREEEDAKNAKFLNVLNIFRKEEKKKKKNQIKFKFKNFDFSFLPILKEIKEFQNLSPMDKKVVSNYIFSKVNIEKKSKKKVRLFFTLANKIKVLSFIFQNFKKKDKFEEERINELIEKMILKKRKKLEGFFKQNKQAFLSLGNV
jgi:hypothetical protein